MLWWEVRIMNVCNCKCSCTVLALVAAAILGVVAAFLQITGVITVTPAFLWVALGIAVAYLGLLVVTGGRREGCCTVLGTVLAGILGTALFAVVLLAVGVVATSVVSAILVGLLVFFLALILAGTACYVKCVTDCGA